MEEERTESGDFVDDAYLDEVVDLTWDQVEESGPIKFEPGYN